MKVGRITLLTAFLLALPLAAWAGADPCAGLGGDADGDGICESVDNCPGVANPSQTNSDTDGRGDACDNCMLRANGPGIWAPGLALVSQCDTDSDGFGNACDGDLNQNGTVEPGDTGEFIANLTGGGTPLHLAEADMNCNGTIEPGDTGNFIPQLTGGGLPGPWGWACAGTVDGGCPPLP